MAAATEAAEEAAAARLWRPPERRRHTNSANVFTNDSPLMVNSPICISENDARHHSAVRRIRRHLIRAQKGRKNSAVEMCGRKVYGLYWGFQLPGDGWGPRKDGMGGTAEERRVEGLRSRVMTSKHHLIPLTMIDETQRMCGGSERALAG